MPNSNCLPPTRTPSGTLNTEICSPETFTAHGKLEGTRIKSHLPLRERMRENPLNLMLTTVFIPARRPHIPIYHIIAQNNFKNRISED